jgi:hypothetical protein
MVETWNRKRRPKQRHRVMSPAEADAQKTLQTGQTSPMFEVTQYLAGRYNMIGRALSRPVAEISAHLVDKSAEIAHIVAQSHLLMPDEPVFKLNSPISHATVNALHEHMTVLQKSFDAAKADEPFKISPEVLDELSERNAIQRHNELIVKSRDELRSLCSQHEIAGYRKLTKGQMVDALVERTASQRSD